ncbi:MAG: hydrogenase expression/formation protein [Chromatiaceae bacterium]|nr:MAG: hydrogenase expression/formation protein [Chromatiaceae bacterium]
MSVPVPIPVHAGPTDAVPCGRPRGFGNAPAIPLAILHEIRHALERLIEQGETTCIDLAALPFGPADEAQLLALLGRGEVSATIDALGPTCLWETAFPGVWVLDYRNGDDERLALQIEIATVPTLLLTPPADLADSRRTLEARLAAAGSADSAVTSATADTPAPGRHPHRRGAHSGQDRAPSADD